MGDRLAITVPCDLRYRDAVGAAIQELCSRLERSGATPGLTYQVVSAFNEAFNNVVQYAHDGSPGEVEVTVEIHPDRLDIELMDRGRSFPFDEIETPDLSLLPESGLGLFIIRSFMSDVQYAPGERGEPNRLRMVRLLTRPEGSRDHA